MTEEVKTKEPMDEATRSSLDELPVRLLTYNDHKDARLTDIIEHVLPRFDIICMQEMFRSFSRRQGLLRRSAESTGHLHHVVSDEPSFFSTFQLIDGGLVVLSRWPIVEHDQISYSPGVNADFFAAKGAVYAKIVIEKANFATTGARPVNNGDSAQHVVLHVFNTHLQASYDHNASNAANDAARSKQLEDLQRFITSKASMCASCHNEYILLAGDLNVDGRSKVDPCSHSDGYLHMLEQLSIPGYTLHDLLHETEGEHHVTVGDSVGTGDQLQARETILTGRKDHCCMKRLDYVILFEPESLAPEDSTNEGHSTQEQLWRELRHSHTRVEPFFIDQRPYTQLSDHYAVSSEFALPCNIE